MGLWKTPEAGGSFVRIETCGDALCGRVVTSARLRAHPDQKDERNRDATQRDRPVKDLLILKVKAIGPNRWGDGWVYNPNDGGTYKGVMELRNASELHLTGCIVAPFCKTQTWERAASAQ
ncbi:MAG: DUF2147 domain-containing protein [Caulobacteraceae bacterium]|nr:DUF2147 domain-containing protein [Caulobacteraceae bacterium]